MVIWDMVYLHLEQIAHPSGLVFGKAVLVGKAAGQLRDVMTACNGSTFELGGFYVYFFVA